MSINFEYFLYLIYDLFVTLGQMIRDPNLLNLLQAKLDHLWWVFLSISLPLLAGVIYFSLKTSKIWQQQHDRVYGSANIIEDLKEELAVSLPKKNETWEKIVVLSGSDNPNDWKQAIIEADKMLEVVVNTFAVPGDNMGDKMKNIEKGDWQTLDEAWQAHKVRNQIAHEHNFHLSQREARIAIANFEKVFKEFDFI